MENTARLQELLRNVNEELDAYAAKESLEGYKAVQTGIRRLQVAASTPADTLFNFRFQIVENIGVMMLLELAILDALVAKQGESATTVDLAKDSGCEEDLVGRLMRMAGALCFVEQVDQQTYRANEITTSLVQPGWKAALSWMELVYPVAGQLRSFLSSTGFGRTGKKPPAGVTAFTFAHGGKSLWGVMEKQPEQKRNFDLWIQERKKYDETRWRQRYPPLAGLLPDRLRTGLGQQQEAVLMVDVGGISAVQLSRLRQQLPELPGRCILQVPPDKADVMDQKAEGVEVMTYDLSTPQPVKGARFYYLNNVFHNLPDDKCIEILRNMVPAMDPEYSMLLLDDYVLASKNVQLRSAVTDIHVLATFNASDRTSEQYEAIITKGGLEITAIYPAGSNDECIIELKVPRNSK